MLTTIGIIGSIASIVGIPAGWYWFKKSQNDKFNSVKNDIVRTAKSHYGKDGYIDLNQLGSVIRTKLRRAELDIQKLSTGEIIDELITHALDEPLIDLNHKDKLLYELRRLSTNNKVQKLLSYNTKLLSSNDEKVRIKGMKLQKELRMLNEHKTEEKERIINEKLRIDFNDIKFDFTSDTFNNSMKLFTSLGSVFSVLGLFVAIQQFDLEKYGDLIWIGISIIIGLTLAFFYNSFSKLISIRKGTIKDLGDVEDIDFVEID